MLATVLDLRDEDLDSRIAFWTGTSAESVVGMRERLVLAAVIVGVVGGATLGAFMADAAPVSAEVDDGPGIVLDFDDDPDAQPDYDGAALDFDDGPDAQTHIGDASMELDSTDSVVVELDSDDGLLALDFSAIEDAGLGLDLNLDLDLDDDLDDLEFEPESDPAPTQAPEDASSPETQSEDAASPETQPEPEPIAEAVAEPGSGPDTGADVSTSMLGGLEPVADAGADVAGTPTADDRTDDAMVGAEEAEPVATLELIEDQGTADLETDLDTDADAEADSDALTSDFEGTRDWVRQHLDGSWADDWRGDSAILTGSELWQASSGDTSIDMNGNGPGTLSRTIDTIEGETYEISFDMSGNPHGQRGIKTLELSAGDGISISLVG